MYLTYVLRKDKLLIKDQGNRFMDWDLGLGNVENEWDD